ncbi:acyl-CoA dehydrogenase family protein [Klenkia sp. PcliD-1-E]|uniref:acyl-CoA dehydrogenase family protein n=1 Tax=Klenkia sp. PcliD-1-E TaxID=2954492 RepID=UPI002096A055|nr:acyl-CoA dehydrogenase family protein [Klenkia sp. PcliD-1-E]MCO7218268.1 acyl-CoA/acyl-ACP dehydrogenase [Klenkia sp. PcliD-1-E]
MTLDFDEGDELRDLRAAVADLAGRYGHRWFLEQARTGGTVQALWAEAGKAGLLGVNLPEEHGGGGGGMVELAVVLEELGAAGCPLLMMVVSPAICGTVIARYGTAEQRDRWLPGIADGSLTMAFAITEPDAGSNSHEITTTARRDGEEWVLSGQKIWISGVDVAGAVLVVARLADAVKGTLRPALFVVPTDAPGLSRTQIPMELVSPDNQFQLFLDDVRLPADALVGSPDAGIAQLFAGLNPERVMGAAYSLGTARLALDRAAAYARDRRVWGTPIGAHQGVSHPLAAARVEVELARLMMLKAAWLIDSGQDAGTAANSAKYAAAEAVVHAVDAAVQTHGGSGLSQDNGIGALVTASRFSRIAPVSREMVLNFVAQHDLQLPRSY